jgi:phenylpropionate dioxygenase-like ring-hydroxylating dioxygenase large terminal subunit
VRLVGENFVAWRDAGGRIGLFDEYCMHRGASLALGRCEGDGLRCLYHGWKYATDGTILETPNYKKSTVRDKLKAPVYPVREAGGLIWAYLGPRDKEPLFPHYQFFDPPVEQLPIYHVEMDCNFVQMLEGTIDPSHANILHQDSLGKRYTNMGNVAAGDRLMNTFFDGPENVDFIAEDNAPHCEVEDTLFGCHGVAIFDARTSDGRQVNFARTHAFVTPFLSVPGTTDFVFSIPIDDYQTTFFALRGVPIVDTEERERFIQDNYAGPVSNYVNYRYRFTERERWGQDREKMRAGAYTGLPGTVPEDAAMIMSMGPIYDRSRENLVPADQLCIRMRRRMLEAARDLQAGIEPFQLKPDETIKLGGKWTLLSDPARWQEVMVPGHEPFRRRRRETAQEPSAEPTLS